MTSSSSPDVLVPREPTEAMLEAGGRCEPFQMPEGQKFTPGRIIAASVYRAMITASQGSSPKKAIPAPADGQVASQREAVSWEDLAEFMSGWFESIPGLEDTGNGTIRGRYPAGFNDVEFDHTALAQDIVKRFSPTDQSSDVSGLVEGIRDLILKHAMTRSGEHVTPREAVTTAQAIVDAYPALAQANAEVRDGSGFGLGASGEFRLDGLPNEDGALVRSREGVNALQNLGRETYERGLHAESGSSHARRTSRYRFVCRCLHKTVIAY